MYGHEIGDLWSELLIGRDYHITKNDYGIPIGTVRYSVGQPMGALSSWAMLALTHHLIVQYCTFQIYGRFQYSHYEVLGDDIVIFDKDVATSYLSVMRDLGVEINLSKSISSPDGTAFEFAKRTGFKGQDVSPLPFKLFMLPYSKSSLSSIFDKLEQMKILNVASLLSICIPNVRRYLTESFDTRFQSKSLRIGIINLLGSRLKNPESLRVYYAMQLDPSIIKIGNGLGSFPTLTAMRTLMDDAVKLTTSSPYFYFWLVGLTDQLKLDYESVKRRLSHPKFISEIPRKVVSKMLLSGNTENGTVVVPRLGIAVSDPKLYSNHLSRWVKNITPSLLSTPLRGIFHIRTKPILDLVLPESEIFSALTRLTKLYIDMIEYDQYTGTQGISIEKIYEFYRILESLREAEVNRSMDDPPDLTLNETSPFTLSVDRHVKTRKKFLMNFLRSSRV